MAAHTLSTASDSMPPFPKLSRAERRSLMTVRIGSRVEVSWPVARSGKEGRSKAPVDPGDLEEKGTGVGGRVTG